MTDEHIKLYINEFMDERGIKEGDDLHESDLIEFAKLFLGVVDVNDRVFLGVGSWLMWIHGCLLEVWFDMMKLHEGEKISDVPELIAAGKMIDEFREFCRVYLGFDYKDGEFIDRKDRGDRFDRFKKTCKTL